VPKKKPSPQDDGVSLPKRVKLSPEESLKRMQEFDKRKEAFIASIRKGKDRGVSS
jgi:hypothetical protein